MSLVRENLAQDLEISRDNRLCFQDVQGERIRLRGVVTAGLDFGQNVVLQQQLVVVPKTMGLQGGILLGVVFCRNSE